MCLARRPGLEVGYRLLSSEECSPWHCVFGIPNPYARRSLVVCWTERLVCREGNGEGPRPSFLGGLGTRSSHSCVQDGKGSILPHLVV